MRLILLAVTILALAGCGSSDVRTNTQTDTFTQGYSKKVHTVTDTQGSFIEETIHQENVTGTITVNQTTTYRLPELSAFKPQEGSLLDQGLAALAGLVPGGLTAYALYKRLGTTTATLKKVVDEVEVMPEDAKKPLLENLSKRMDAVEKQEIKKQRVRKA